LGERTTLPFKKLQSQRQCHDVARGLPWGNGGRSRSKNCNHGVNATTLQGASLGGTEVASVDKKLQSRRQCHDVATGLRGTRLGPGLAGAASRRRSRAGHALNPAAHFKSLLAGYCDCQLNFFRTISIIPSVTRKPWSVSALVTRLSISLCWPRSQPI